MGGLRMIGGGGLQRSGNTTHGHLATWNGNDANSLADGGPVPEDGSVSFATAQEVTAGTVTDKAIPPKALADAGVARPYKSYVALLSQADTNAPTAIVLENTLGGTVVWTREDVGIYHATLIGAFPTNKVWSPPVLIYNGSYFLGFSLIRSNDDVLDCYVDDASGVLNDLLAARVSIEIRVYP